MDERLRQEVTAWLEFYRELGIEGFYPAPRASSRDAVAPPAAVLEPAKPAATAASRLSTSASRLPTEKAGTPVVLPGVPAQALNLFEAPAPKRAEHETLEQIREDLGDCHRCRLAAGRKTIVFGQGNPHAELVFVGEGPGADEDEQGLPFVGRAGQLLNRMLQYVGIKREDVYICNVVKCRPPGNRTPEKDEVEACSPFLFRQLQAIHPRLICCLGAPAVRTLLGVKEGMLKIRGHFYDYGGTKALATVHPAYVLRNPREEKILREDFEKIRDFLKRR
ncbi:MAG TPA: uracil-DNA glycosylase [Terriglobia bacterium]|nr:uracil-DNA glycosylase [Terriglobia bacterium]